LGAELQSYHTNSRGEDFGWWGSWWHPAHFDTDGKEIPNSAWKFDVQNAETLEEAKRNLFEQILNAKKSKE